MIVGGGDDVSFMPFVYHHGTVSVSSLGYFFSVGSSSKTCHPSLNPSLGLHRIKEYFKKKRRRKRKHIKPQDENYRHKQEMKKMRVTLRARLFVGYWELVPMES